MTCHFCTISTASHLGKTYALIHSIKAVHESVVVHVLLLDKKSVEVTLPANLKTTAILYDAENLKSNELFTALQQRYSASPDKFRWSLKPVFLKWLLQTSIEKIIYVDNDIYFAGNGDFLFEMLDRHNVLVTPHHRPDNPFTQSWWFETNFRDGIFNAGFFGANKNAIPALEWWANACLYKCTKSYRKGFFDDQKYLDLMPVIEPETGIVHHKGCNIAYWNMDKLNRTVTEQGIFIDNHYPVIFIHFADCTISAITGKEDGSLTTVLNDYLAILKQYGISPDLQKIRRKETFWVFYREWKWLLLGGIFVRLRNKRTGAI